MKINPTSAAQKTPMYWGVFVGLITSVITTLLLTGLFAWLIVTERLQENAIGYGVLAIILTASILGACVCSAFVKIKRMLACLLSGIAYIITLFACTALFFGGKYQGITATCLCILGACVCVGMFGLKEKKSRYHHKIRSYS